MIVPTPGELVRAEEPVIRPGLSNGSAHGLPMTEREAAKRRRKQPFGFTAPVPKKRKKKRK